MSWRSKTFFITIIAVEKNKYLVKYRRGEYLIPSRIDEEFYYHALRDCQKSLERFCIHTSATLVEHLAIPANHTLQAIKHPNMKLEYGDDYTQFLTQCQMNVEQLNYLLCATISKPKIIKWTEIVPEYRTSTNAKKIIPHEDKKPQSIKTPSVTFGARSLTRVKQASMCDTAPFSGTITSFARPIKSATEYKRVGASRAQVSAPAEWIQEVYGVMIPSCLR